MDKTTRIVLAMDNITAAIHHVIALGDENLSKLVVPDLSRIREILKDQLPDTDEREVE